MMKKIGLTGNQLKLLAMVAMTIDHAGLLLLPQCTVLRIIGRLAFPIFAYMIAEGCRYTRSKPRYLGLCAAIAALCQIVYFLFADGSLFQCILVTFSLAIGLIWIFDHAAKKKQPALWVAAAAALLAVYFLTELLPGILKNTDYGVDYGFWGVMLPVGVYFGKNKQTKLGFAALCLGMLGWQYRDVQWFALAAIPLLALYNGRRGKWKLKYLFYIYYPAHLAALQLLAMLL